MLFDFDGVIADTENVHIAAWERTFDWMGWDVSPEECAKAAAVDDRVFLARLFEKRKVTGGDVAGWVAHKQRITVAMLRDSPRMVAGAKELIEELAARQVLLGVVTDTWRENVAVVLGAAGLMDRFQVIVGKEDVKKPKPDPAGYRLALRKMKLSAKSAAAIEDSEGGLLACDLAGLRCVIVSAGGEKPEWAAQAACVLGFQDLEQVLRLLGFADEA